MELLLLMFPQCDVWKSTPKFGQNLCEPGPIANPICLKNLSTAVQDAVGSTFSLKATMFNLFLLVFGLDHEYGSFMNDRGRRCTVSSPLL
jgi:hypothetical protein